MFNIGGGEFLVIALIALIVLGPQRLPEAARQVGKFMGELRRVSSGFQNELKGALDDAERAAKATPPRDVLAVEKDGSPEPATPPADGSAAPARSRTRPPRKAPLKAAPPSKAAGARAKRP
jgi:sec-independent protein translocase protein TatB